MITLVRKLKMNYQMRNLLLYNYIQRITLLVFKNNVNILINTTTNYKTILIRINNFF